MISKDKIKSILYFRLKSLNKRCERYKLAKAEMNEASSYQDIMNVFQALNNVYVRYYKYLKNQLHFQGIQAYFPLDIVKHNKILGIETNIDVQLYAKCLSNILYNHDKEIKKQIYLYIIENYEMCLMRAVKELNARYIGYTPQKLRESLPYDKPDYDNVKLMLDKFIYDTILGYFKQNKNIKYVWAFGSRVEGWAQQSSDIDLLVDIPEEYIQDCDKDLKNLSIPVYIDAKYVTNNQEQSDIVQSLIMYNELELIYCAEDFNK